MVPDSKLRLMLKFRWLLGARGISLALFLSAICPGVAAERQVLHGHVPVAVAHFKLQPTGQLPAATSLHLAIGLPLRNQEALTGLIQQLYNPANPHYHQYLTPEQFTDQFGPTEQDYQNVIAFAKRNGLTVTGTSANRVLLEVNGSVADVEKAFQITMRTYRHPTENRTFYAPDVEPSVESGVPVLDVSGLSDYGIPHPQSLKAIPRLNPADAVPNAGSGPNGYYRGNDFRAAYLPGVTLNGAGQTVGLLEFDGYYTNDIISYENQSGLTNVPLQNVYLNGATGSAGSGDIEVSLDIEVAIAMAPALTKVVVFEAPNSTAYFNSLLSSMVASNQIKQFSCSWSYSGTPDATMDQLFQQMITQGQSFFDASGDSDAYTGSTGVPNDDPNITIAGGTTLSTTGPGGAWVSETVWNSGGGQGSSGGISTYYSIPSWQTNVNLTANLGSTNMRNIPDVAMVADKVWCVYSNGYSSGYVRGTSIAAPLWAGLTALMNQQTAMAGRPSVGFLNPAIYAIGNGMNYANDFHDITTGNNTWSGSPNNFYAVPGYDLCTGWGTPAGQSLINDLAGSPDTLVIAPASGFAASGAAGGPFNVTTQIFLLTNSGAASLNWTLASTSLWLNVSTGGGTLASGGQTTVTANLNSAADNLAAGIYSANVWFTNQTTGVAQLRQFALQVGQPLVQNGGFEAANFTGWILSGNTAYTSVTSGNSQFVHSGTYGAELGPSGSLGYLSQTLPTVAGQNYLLSVWMDSPNMSGTLTPNEFSVSWNGSIIFDKLNIGKIGWTNLQFIVTATSSSTVLQLGFRDDPYYLGLDDISVTPVPVPAFQTATITSSAFNFTLGTMAGLVYQVQYKTNLLQTNWINLGKLLVATNTSLTVSDTNAIGSSPQKFYRVQVLP
jgi:subtilase family serine protease